MNNYLSCIPPGSLELVNYKGSQLIDKLGSKLINEIISSILCGDNIRDLTETLTQRRLILLNASLFLSILKAESYLDSFREDSYSHILNLLSEKHTQAEKVWLYWLLGLTGKSLQNVVRDKSRLTHYISKLEKNIKDILSHLRERYGEVELTVANTGHNYAGDWQTLVKTFLALGAQTLTIRGSEKSAYGKLFEKLVMGSLLTLLGFKFIGKHDLSSHDMVFWLSERQNKRESDATALLKPGYGVRFDIGFIGKGNPEISLDKVSRFEHAMKRDGENYNLLTIIIVDSIGAHSRIVEMASQIGGCLVQMNGSYWVRELASLIKTNFTFFDSPILSLDPDASLAWIREEMASINLEPFLA